MEKEYTHNKLVRDKIPEIIEKSGKDCTIHLAGEDEYRTELLKKLRKETREFIEEPCEEEIADILEVLDALVEHYNFSYPSIHTIKKNKGEERGIFKERIILEKVSK